MSNATRLTIQDVRQHLTTLSPDIARSLPPGVSLERFTTVALTAIQNTPKLLECDPASLFNACMKAAQDGLLPDGREGAIIPRWNSRTKRTEATWQPMVAGLQAKAKRRGNVASLVANVVYRGETFEVLLGDEDRIIHRRDLTKVKPNNEIAVYAIATMKDGSKEREVMTWEQVLIVRQVSTDPNGPAWTKWTDEMARKSVIRRLAKRLPSLDDGDDELRQAVERVDELYPFGKPAAEATPQIEQPNGTRNHLLDERLASLRMDLEAADNREAVVAFGNSERVRKAKLWLADHQETIALRELEAMLAEAFARVAAAPPHDPDTGEIADNEVPF